MNIFHDRMNHRIAKETKIQVSMIFSPVKLLQRIYWWPILQVFIQNEI